MGPALAWWVCGLAGHAFFAVILGYKVWEAATCSGMLGWKKSYSALLPSTLLKDPVGCATALPFSSVTLTFAWRKYCTGPLLLPGRYSDIVEISRLCT